MSSREEKRKQYWLKKLKRSTKQRVPRAKGASRGFRPVSIYQEDDEDLVTGSNAGVPTDHHERDTESGNSSSRKKRYILFLGNMSFTTTATDVETHFMKRGVAVQQVRMLTHKDTGQSKGCCFIEFSTSKHQQNALKFHHTKLDGRTINIEVTCGGGGKTEHRMEKIRKRNEKLASKMAAKRQAQRERQEVQEESE